MTQKKVISGPPLRKSTKIGPQQEKKIFCLLLKKSILQKIYTPPPPPKTKKFRPHQKNFPFWKKKNWNSPQNNFENYRMFFLDWWPTHACILIMVQHVRMVMFSLNMVDYPISFLLKLTWFFFGRQLEGTIVRHSYYLSIVLGPLPNG